MADPKPLAPIAGDKLTEQQAVAAWIDDMTAYQMLREQTQKLQAFVKNDCN